ncbi:MAG: 2-keto-4-pentenoate hydratase [Alphaproteobacteria bacterium]|nr:fumarylacetoacetate hydrolase family protein [Alphaproteobacteria bacterium]TAD91244.1 MAG: 2-keto-4-pentenoate hydratase [Alphaproteobacteria bacterium]
MTRPSRFTRAVDLLVDAFETGAPLAPLPEDMRPQTPAEGYRIQEMLAERLGYGIVGWKIGATNPGARKMFKTRSPFASRLFKTRLMDSGASLPGAAMRMRGIESEFCLILASSLPPRANAYSAAEVMAAIGGVRAAFEVVEPRWTDWLAAGIASVIADMGGNGQVVLGDGVDGLPKTDLSECLVEFEVNGDSKARGAGIATEGSPVNALLWLANKVRTGPGLEAGQIIMTGSCTGLFKAAPGDRLRARFEGLGEVALTL